MVDIQRQFLNLLYNGINMLEQIKVYSDSTLVFANPLFLQVEGKIHITLAFIYKFILYLLLHEHFGMPI